MPFILIADEARSGRARDGLQLLNNLNLLFKGQIRKPLAPFIFRLKQILHPHVCKIKSLVFHLLLQIELFRKYLPLLSQAVPANDIAKRLHVNAVIFN